MGRERAFVASNPVRRQSSPHQPVDLVNYRPGEQPRSAKSESGVIQASIDCHPDEEGPLRTGSMHATNPIINSILLQCIGLSCQYGFAEVCEMSLTGTHVDASHRQRDERISKILITQHWTPLNCPCLSRGPCSMSTALRSDRTCRRYGIGCLAGPPYRTHNEPVI